MLAQLSYGPGQAAVVLRALPAGEALEHADAFGRIAFSVPREQLIPLQAAVSAAGYSLLKPLVALGEETQSGYACRSLTPF